MYVVITENDESAWDDDTGALYHFPKRSLKHLHPGTKALYYKGNIKNKSYSTKRLSDRPHYFGVARIGKIYPDRNSSKGDYFAVIEDFRQFNTPVLAKTEKGYFETIPDNKLTNYWRDGTRAIDKATYDSILAVAGSSEQVNEPTVNNLNDVSNGLESFVEGGQQKKYVTVFEREPKLRLQAVAIHGTRCMACNFDFGEFYGEYAKGLIHIHHVQPVSKLSVPTIINPETDLIPLCANCHSVVHRRKDKTLSIDELLELIKS